MSDTEPKLVPRAACFQCQAPMDRIAPDTRSSTKFQPFYCCTGCGAKWPIEGPADE